MPELFPLLVFVLILIVIGVGWYFSSPKWIGNRGEAVVRKVLDRLPEDYHVLNDVVLKTRTGTTQIDHVGMRSKTTANLELGPFNVHIW